MTLHFTLGILSLLLIAFLDFKSTGKLEIYVVDIFIAALIVLLGPLSGLAYLLIVKGNTRIY